MQCDLIHNQFLRILKPNGTIWIGWTGSVEFKNPLSRVPIPKQIEDWRDCLGKAGNKIVFTVLKEMDFFGASEYRGEHVFSVFIKKLDVED